MEEAAKPVSASRTEQIQILMPQHINGYKRLFGGVLMEWIDIVAGVVARRHSNSEVTTASVDNLQFKSPAYVNSTNHADRHDHLCGKLLYGGDGGHLYRSAFRGARLVNRAYVVMVALVKMSVPSAYRG